MAPEPADVEMQCDETLPPPTAYEIEEVLIDELPYVSRFSKSRNGKRDVLHATLHCRHAGPQATIATSNSRSLDEAALQLRETLQREHGGPACLAETANFTMNVVNPVAPPLEDVRRSGRTGVVAARAQRERVEAQREDATYNMPAEIENEILRRCW